jgi:predicted transcriptional regulator
MYLTKLQLAILDIVWKHKVVSVSDIQQILYPQTKHPRAKLTGKGGVEGVRASIHTMIEKFIDAGIVTKRIENKIKLIEPVYTREEFIVIMSVMMVKRLLNDPLQSRQVIEALARELGIDDNETLGRIFDAAKDMPWIGNPGRPEHGLSNVYK